MQLEIIENPGREWDDFAERYSDIIFFRSIWGEVLKDGLGASLNYYCLIDGGSIVGGMPAVSLKYWNLNLFYSLIPYGGYIGEKEYKELFYRELVKKLQSPDSRVDVAYFLPSPFGSEQPDDERMRKEKTPITYIDLDSKTLTDVERGFNRGVMQSVRKSGKNKLKFKVCTDKQSMNIAFSLYRETMKRNRAIVKYREKWFEVVHKVLIEKGLASLCMVFYNNIPVASVIPVYSGRGMHLLNNGSATEYLHLRANDFMIYEIIKDGIERQKKYIDLMNSNLDDKKLIHWKEKFGSRTEHKYTYTLVNSRFKNACWNAAKKTYPILFRGR